VAEETRPNKIAVVDDDRAVCDSLQFFLEVMGYVVETFLSAATFLSADHREIGRMILDHHMPQMTGLELAEKLRANAVDLPILLITGSPSPDILARAAKLGIRVLEKPPGENDLLAFTDGSG
jgi:FixJ family two-component response regulator